jgi:hypothetical protein
MQAAETGANDQHIAVEAGFKARALSDGAGVAACIVGGEVPGRMHEHAMKLSKDYFMKKYTTIFISPSRISSQCIYPSASEPFAGGPVEDRQQSKH